MLEFFLIWNSKGVRVSGFEVSWRGRENMSGGGGGRGGSGAGNSG